MRVVAIGGGTGLAVLLRGLKQLVISEGSQEQRPITRLTAVVTVTDEGGSSGRLRRDFGMLPPGDVRNCLVALAEDEKILTRLFNYRFSAGKGLRGHSLGNLFLTALTKLTGDFSLAVRLASEVLAVRGEIFPATLADVRLSAQLADGRRAEGESEIHNTSVRIRKLSIVPARCRPMPETLEAVAEADLITVGPGSLYTSLLPNLLVSRIAEQIARSKATRVFIGNLMTQPGETRGYTASEHLEPILQHVGRNIFDFAVLNTRPFPIRMRRRYAAEQAEPVANDLVKIQALGVVPVCVPLLQSRDGVARHDAARLARLLLDLVSRRSRSSKAASGHRGRAPRRQPARLPA